MHHRVYREPQVWNFTVIWKPNKPMYNIYPDISPLHLHVTVISIFDDDGASQDKQGYQWQNIIQDV